MLFLALSPEKNKTYLISADAGALKEKRGSLAKMIKTNVDGQDIGMPNMLVIDHMRLQFFPFIIHLDRASKPMQ